MGTNRPQMYAESYIVKTRGEVGSAFYKYDLLAAKENWNLKAVAALGEGGGSALKAMIRTSECVYGHYVSIMERTSFIDGKMNVWMPPALDDELSAKKIPMLHESVMGSSDLSVRATVSHQLKLCRDGMRLRGAERLTCGWTDYVILENDESEMTRKTFDAHSALHDVLPGRHGRWFQGFPLHSTPLTHSRPGVPWSPPLCRWLLRGRRGTWCSARGRMYALASLGLRWLLRRRRGTWCPARGRIYALASLGLRCSAGGFCVAGAALGALQGVAGAALGGVQGVGCTPWRPLVSTALPWLLRGTRGTWCSARGWMYALASLGLWWLLRGRRGVPWSRPLCRWLLRGRRGTWCSARRGKRGTWCSARGRMYALASLGLRWLLRGRRALGALQGVGCTPWRFLVSAALPVAFAWQARHLVLCKGSDVRPGVPWSLLLCQWLLLGRRGTWCSARGRMLALATLGLRCLLRGRRGTQCSARGRM